MPRADRHATPGRFWHLVTVLVDDGPQAAIELADTVVIPPFLDGVPGVIAAVQQWSSLAEPLRAWTPGSRDTVVDAPSVLTLQYPPKVLCSGPNYVDHLAEMGEADLGEEWIPFFFLKPPTTTLVHNDTPVLIDDPADQVDWEGELAVVIGEGGRHIAAEVALDHVAGYMAANDVSLRRPHHRNTPARPFQWDWVSSKCADTSLPIGPGLRPAWQVPDPQALRLTTTVNGQTMQDGHTSAMVLPIAELVAGASRQVTLEPGDVILTGTPAGVGLSRGSFLSPGDEVRVSIESVGSIANRIQQRPHQDKNQTNSADSVDPQAARTRPTAAGGR